MFLQTYEAKENKKDKHACTEIFTLFIRDTCNLQLGNRHKTISLLL